jgi:hypothetical protein
MSRVRSKFAIGDRIGRLTILEDLGTREGSFEPSRQRYKKVRWYRCRCSCGALIDTSSNIFYVCPQTASCGCSKTDANRSRLPDGEASFRSVFAKYRIHAEERLLPFNLSEDQFRTLVSTSCHYCGSPPSNRKKSVSGKGDLVYSGLDRVDNSRGYFIDNVVPCCEMCNLAKKDFSKRDFLAWVSRVYRHNFAQFSATNDVLVTF